MKIFLGNDAQKKIETRFNDVKAKFLDNVPGDFNRDELQDVKLCQTGILRTLYRHSVSSMGRDPLADIKNSIELAITNLILTDLTCSEIALKCIDDRRIRIET